MAIRKPADDWGQESAAVGAMRSAAAGGKAVVETGTRLARGGFQCLFGGLFLFAGLAGGLIGGSIPTLLGAGGIGAYLLWSGLRLMKGTPKSSSPDVGSFAASEPAYAARGGGQPATTINYSRGKLLVQAGLGALALVASLSGFGYTDGMLRVIVIFLIPVFGAMAVLSAIKAFGDLTALRWDAEGLTVAGLIKRQTASWSSIHAIGIRQINTYAYGIVKVASRRVLDIRLGDGMFAKRMSVNHSVLEMEGRSLEGLVLTLQAAQLGRLAGYAPERPGAPEAAAPTFARSPASFAEASAPARRYQEPAPAPAPRPAAAPAAPPRPAVYGATPARTTFGRRGT